MATETMAVVELDRSLVDASGNASAVLGNAEDDFVFPNDGKTFLIVDGVTGDTLTFTAVACTHGRTETLAPVIAALDVAMIGPFPPELWNNGDGQVAFTPTAGNVADVYLAVRFP